MSFQRICYRFSFRIPHSALRIEKGQAMVEYVLVVAAVLTALLASRFIFEKAFGGLYKRIATVVSSPAP